MAPYLASGSSGKWILFEGVPQFGSMFCLTNLQKKAARGSDPLAKPLTILSLAIPMTIRHK